MRPLLSLHRTKSYLVNWVKSRGKTVQSIYIGEGRPKELLDSFQPRLSRGPWERCASISPTIQRSTLLPSKMGHECYYKHSARPTTGSRDPLCRLQSALLERMHFEFSASSSGLNEQSHLFKAPFSPGLFDSRCVAWSF